jgi:hypothetical protein
LHCQEYDVKGQSHFWGSNQPLSDYIEVLSPIVLRGLRPISAKYNSVREHHQGSKDGALQLHPFNMA